jgi:hypothetical protein
MNSLNETYFEITDAGDIIRLEPINLSYPNADLDWDRSWLKTKVTVQGRVFSGQFVAEFMTVDFEKFRRELKALDKDFNGNATFKPIEEQLVLSIKGDGLGHFEVDCEATPEHHLGQTLTFSMSFDQTQLKDYVRQLDRITKAFPIDGDFMIQNE